MNFTCFKASFAEILLQGSKYNILYKRSIPRISKFKFAMLLSNGFDLQFGKDILYPLKDVTPCQIYSFGVPRTLKIL